jgi:hypothetical protein
MFGKTMRPLLLNFVVLVLCCSSAFAADKSDGAAPFLSELRGGVYYNNLENYGEQGADVNGEILLRPITGTYNNAFVQFLLTPRPHLGATLNTQGNTSFVYTGLTWSHQLFDSPLFIEGSFGAALHNGHTGSVRRTDAANLGCAALFHEAGSIGIIFENKLRVMATIEHFSNAGLCKQNQGMTNIGMRVGKLF